VGHARGRIVALGLTLWAGLVAGCSSPLPRIDSIAGIDRATLVDSAIEWTGADAAVGASDAKDQVTGETLSLAAATQLALRNSQTLQAALWRVRVAEADARQERLLPNPVIALTMRFVSGGGKPAVEASVAGDLLSLLRRGRKIDAADDRLRGAAAEALKEAIDVTGEAQEQYVAAAVIEEELTVLTERRRLLDRVVDVAQRRFEAGEGTRLDVTTLEAQRLELEADAADRQAERVQARITLARVIGRPAGRTDWRLEPVANPDAVAGAETDWIAAAIAARPELQSHRWELAALGEEQALAKWNVFDPSEVGVMSQRDPDWQVGPSVSLPLPIFDNGQAKRDKAAAQRVAAAHAWVATRRQVIEEVRKAYATTLATRAAVDHISGKLLPLLQTRSEQAEAAYRAGETDLTTFLLAEDTLQTTRFKLIELKEKAAVARVKLERATGGAGAAATVSPATRPATRP